MFIFILVFALNLGDKVPFDGYGFVAQYKTANECKVAVKKATEGLSKEEADRVFCIQVVDQSKFSKEI